MMRMRSAVSVFAIAATLLLHAAMLIVVLRGWPQDTKTSTEASPLAVRLVPPAPVQAPEPARPLAAPPPSPPVEKPPPPKPESRPPKPRKAREPAAAPKPARPQPESASPSASSTQSDAAAPAPAIQPGPAPSAAAPPAPPAAPVTVPPSEARYAASNRKPAYPALSRRYGEEGTVVLRVLVQADGSAGEVQIKSSSGYPLLDESAQSTVRTWRFTPATVDGKPVAQWYQLAIPFTLHD